MEIKPIHTILGTLFLIIVVYIMNNTNKFLTYKHNTNGNTPLIVVDKDILTRKGIWGDYEGFFHYLIVEPINYKKYRTPNPIRVSEGFYSLIEIGDTITKNSIVIPYSCYH